MATVLLFAVCATLAGAAKEIAIAYRYGVGKEVDAYQFLFNVAQWPLAVFGSVFTAALVPLVARLRSENRQRLSSFQTEVILCALCLAVLTYPVMTAVINVIVDSEFIALPDAVQDLAAAMVQPMVAAMCCGVVALTLGGWLLAAHRHANTLLQAIPAVAVLVAVLLFPPTAGLLVWSTAAGFFCYALASWVVLRPEIQWQRLGGWSGMPYWRGLLVGMGTLLGGQVLTSLVTFVDQFFAVRLGVGALSTFGYANRIAAIAATIGALVISRAMLPVLSNMTIDAPERVVSVAMRYAVAAFLCATVVAIGGGVLSEQLVRILYERGQFEPADSVRVARLVRYAFAQVPFYLASMVLVSALLAQGRYRGVIYAAALSSAIKLSLAGVLVGRYGLPGLMAATALVYLASAIFCALQLKRHWFVVQKRG